MLLLTWRCTEMLRCRSARCCSKLLMRLQEDAQRAMQTADIACAILSGGSPFAALRAGVHRCKLQPRTSSAPEASKISLLGSSNESSARLRLSWAVHDPDQRDSEGRTELKLSPPALTIRARVSPAQNKKPDRDDYPLWLDSTFSIAQSGGFLYYLPTIYSLL
jgi:hypothetical protein